MQFLRLIVERILLSLLTLLLVSLIIFFMLEILPGDVATRILGRDATPESSWRRCASACIWMIRRSLRYGRWLGHLADRRSRQFAGQRPARRRHPGAAHLQHRAALALCLRHLPPADGHPGDGPGVRRDRPVDHVLSVVTLVLLSMPDFLLGTILLLTFVIAVPLLPAMSLVDESSSAMRISASHDAAGDSRSRSSWRSMRRACCATT